MSFTLSLSLIMAVIKVTRNHEEVYPYEKVDYSNFKHYLNLINRI